MNELRRQREAEERRRDPNGLTVAERRALEAREAAVERRDTWVGAVQEALEAMQTVGPGLPDAPVRALAARGCRTAADAGKLGLVSMTSQAWRQRLKDVPAEALAAATFLAADDQASLDDAAAKIQARQRGNSARAEHASVLRRLAELGLSRNGSKEVQPKPNKPKPKPEPSPSSSPSRSPSPSP
eukprot:COSAG04_NODE_12407_length_654_cov_1.000000_1_plen_184_part_01